MPENWSWRTRQLLSTCRCVSVMLLRSMQYTKELADAASWNDALRDDVAAGRRRLHISSLSAAWSHHASAIMQPPRLADTSLNGIISPSERGWSLCKNNWKEPRSILMSSVDRVAHIDGQIYAIIVSNTHALPAEYSLHKNRATHLRNACRASVNNIAPPNLAASMAFFVNQVNQLLMGGWSLFVTAGLCFEQ